MQRRDVPGDSERIISEDDFNILKTLADDEDLLKRCEESINRFGNKVKSLNDGGFVKSVVKADDGNIYYKKDKVNKDLN